ncbi:MAG: hypothetical protein ABI321_14420 [Polyangia bacterium]
MRAVLCAFLLAFVSTGCGASAKQTPGEPVSMIPHLGPHDDVGDVVTGAMTAPQSPGLNGPSTPGGTGAGGGTIRPQ